MVANILNNQELTAGTVTTKGSYYYIVMTWSETIQDGESVKIKKKSKWLPTKISVKESGGKTKVNNMLLLVRLAFDKNNPNVPISKLLSEDTAANKQTNCEVPPQNEQEMVQDKGILFSDYMLEWLEDIRSRIEITTFSSYQWNVTKAIAPYFKKKNIYLSDITAQDIHMFYKDMLRTGLKAETVIRYHSNIRKALVDALEFNEIYKIDANILVKLKKPYKPEKEAFIPSFYSVDEINEMFEAFKGHRLELIVKLTSFYGFRRSEVLGLKWSAIDFKQNVIIVKHTVTQCNVDGKSEINYKDRTKNRSSRRTMPLVADLRDILIEHKKTIDANRKDFGKTYDNEFNEYICVNENGNLIKPGYVTKIFAKVLCNNGLRKIRFHDLRHSCASLLVASGVPMKMIQEWLGHSNFSTTADRYSHLEHTQKIESANALVNIGIGLKIM